MQRLFKENEITNVCGYGIYHITTKRDAMPRFFFEYILALGTATV